MKRIVFLLFIYVAVACNHQTDSHLKKIPEIEKSATNFIIANDLGRNGYYEQKNIAAIMGETAEKCDIEFIAAAGDVHHFMGVRSVNDPLWMTNYELIYSHPELMIKWYAICGNHEYRGNTQAVLDYSNVSRRWIAPSKYYTFTEIAEDGTPFRLLFIDTTPLIDKYRKDTIGYPDASKQDMETQLQWIDSVLTNASEKWTIVIGHHPVYAGTEKIDSERTDMQQRLAPILEKHKVDAYFCGHIHNYQHIRPAASHVNYIVNSSASLSRKVITTPDTKFCSPDAGFIFCSLTNDNFTFFFINHQGEIIYQYKLTKE